MTRQQLSQQMTILKTCAANQQKRDEFIALLQQKAAWEGNMNLGPPVFDKLIKFHAFAKKRMTAETNRFAGRVASIRSLQQVALPEDGNPQERPLDW